MPFTADYLTSEEVDNEYRETLRNLEKQQLRMLIQRIMDPLSPDQYERVTLALKSVEQDWECTKRLRETPLSPEVIDGRDS